MKYDREKLEEFKEKIEERPRWNLTREHQSSTYSFYILKMDKEIAEIKIFVVDRAKMYIHYKDKYGEEKSLKDIKDVDKAVKRTIPKEL